MQCACEYFQKLCIWTGKGIPCFGRLRFPDLTLEPRQFFHTKTKGLCVQTSGRSVFFFLHVAIRNSLRSNKNFKNQGAGWQDRKTRLGHKRKPPERSRQHTAQYQVKRSDRYAYQTVSYATKCLAHRPVLFNIFTPRDSLSGLELCGRSPRDVYETLTCEKTFTNENTQEHPTDTDRQTTRS